MSALLLVPAAAGAKLTLRDTAARTITFEQLARGKGIVVCNEGAKPVERIHVRFQHVALTQRGTPIGTDKVLMPVPRRRSLAPGACGRLDIRLWRGIALDHTQVAGGSLAVTSTAGTLRLPLTLDAEADTTVTPAEGPDATIELRAKRDNPIQKDTKLVDGAMLALHVAQPGRAPAVNPSGVLGMVVQDTHRAVIRASGPPRRDLDDESVWLLPVSAEGLEEPGTYSGTLDIGGSGDATSGIAVEVAVGDTWQWPTAAVLAGALGAFLGQLWVGNWLLRWRFWRRRRGLAKAYCEVDAGLVASLPPGSRVRRPTNEDVASYARLVKRQMKSAFWWFALVDRTSSAYSGIHDSLRRAERDAACLSSSNGGVSTLAKTLAKLAAAGRALVAFAGIHDPLRRAEGDATSPTSSNGGVSKLAKRLAKLDATARALVSFANERCDRTDVPGPARRAVALVTGGALEVGGALKLVDVAEQHVAFMHRWRRLVERALIYERWWRELSVRLVLPIEQGGLDAADRRRLVHVGSVLHQAQNELYRTPDPETLQRHGTEAKLDGVYERLGQLRALHWAEGSAGVVSESDVPVQELLDEAGVIYAWPDLGDEDDGDGPAGSISFEHVRETSAGATIEPAAPVRVIPGLPVLIDIAVLAFSMAVGLVVVLGQFYFGKTFGSAEDYLTLIAAGAGSQLLVSGLAKMLGDMHAADDDPVAVIDPAAAKLHL